MPTYQYACRSCDHRFEVVQGFSEDALRICPSCEQQELRKLFGNVGVVFKGSGFYRNDSRSKAATGSSPAKPAAAASESSAPASASAPADAKPAAKAPAPATS